MRLIACVRKLSEENIKIKIAISLRVLLEKSKLYTQTKGKNDAIGDSYNTIALNAEIRKATVTNIFNANSSPNSTTLIFIIEAMGFRFRDFSEIFDSITDKDIQKFKKEKKN